MNPLTDSATDSQEPALVPLRILVVEDHPDTLKYISMHLEDGGHQVQVARGMHEALQLLSTPNVDVLLSDIGLRDGDGWELLRLANLPSNIYCIAMSGFGFAKDTAKSKAAGFRHHLHKPFLPRELDDCLEEATRELISRR